MLSRIMTNSIVDEQIANTDPQLWDTMCCITQSKSATLPKWLIDLNSPAYHVKWVRWYFLLCAIMFSMNAHLLTVETDQQAYLLVTTCTHIFGKLFYSLPLLKSTDVQHCCFITHSSSTISCQRMTSHCKYKVTWIFHCCCVWVTTFQATHFSYLPVPFNICLM